MTDCTNNTMRDLLPELAHDALSADDAARVRAHIASCAACAAELRILSAAGELFANATPKVDTAAIVAARFVAVSLSALWFIARGYELRH